MAAHSAATAEIAAEMRIRCDDRHQGDRHAAPATSKAAGSDAKRTDGLMTRMLVAHADAAAIEPESDGNER
jgi:hypothetical protein